MRQASFLCVNTHYHFPPQRIKSIPGWAFMDKAAFYLGLDAKIIAAGWLPVDPNPRPKCGSLCKQK
jgi:hypothetical protein